MTPKTFEGEWRKDQWNLARDLPLEPDATVDATYDARGCRAQVDRDLGHLLTEIAERLDPGERLPGFPIWADDFRPVHEAEDIIEAAQLRGEPLPRWKSDFLIKNAIFYERHASVLDRYRLELDAFPPSRRKFEWQAGAHVPLSETVMHFRPSGIRCKQPDYVPALVAITQTTILGNRRRLTPRETARLQGLPDWFEFQPDDGRPGGVETQQDAASYKQMGNGVNVGAAFYVFCRYVLEHADDIGIGAEHVVRAVEAAWEVRDGNPDELLRKS